MHSTVTPIVSTMDVVASTSRNHRNRRSSSNPSSGPTTRTMAAIDGTIGQSQPCVICQYTNAATIPTAPWAKLKTPVVV